MVSIHSRTPPPPPPHFTLSQEAEWTLPERGGEQGDYRAGIRAKIDNAIECLQQQPLSKRAVRLIQFFGGKAVSVVVLTSRACAGDTDPIQFRGQ